MKVIRTVIYLIVLLIAIAIVSLCVLILFVDPNKLKPVITEVVKKETGYQLVIDGNLSWSFYPLFSIKADHLILNSPVKGISIVNVNNVKFAASWRQFFYGGKKLSAQIYVPTINIMNAQLQNLRTTMAWEGKVISFDDISASLYNGSITGSVHGQNFKGLPSWNWNLSANDIQMKPLIQSMQSGNSRLSLAGVGSLQTIGETRGKSHDEIIGHINGTCEFAIANGAIEGVDLNYLIQTADAFINRTGAVNATSENQTRFSSFTGTAIITEGIASTNNLLLTAATFTAKAQGKLNLLSQAINLQVQIDSQESVKSQWQIPVLLSGTLTHPEVGLDTVEIEKALTKKELGNVKEKVVDEIKKHIPEQAGEFLQKLLGQ